MEILAGIALWLILEVIGAIFGEPLMWPAAWLFRPVTNLLRSSAGGWVLAVICLLSAGWFWLGWYYEIHARNVWVIRAAGLSMAGAAVLALASALIWLGRKSGSRRRSGSAY
ncbi:MAG TPA: hypothetical protein VF665_17820 [Longimicrobium sp.]|jgi:hypothetical protein|uniref:hypothetical protein n=1 Tax=Longimicrobium sp. TaxID=2029185 RepID=UPI002EDA4133